MEKEEALALIARYRNGTCTPEEKLLVESWYLEMAKTESMPEGQPDFEQINESIWNALIDHDARLIHRKNKRTIPFTPLKIAAAVLGFVLAAGTIWWFLNPVIIPDVPQLAATDIGPASNKAILTLANGQQITLDSLHQGELSKLAGLSIQQSKNGKVTYTITKSTITKSDETTGEQLNTISTPKGGQYEIVLEDGTHVWLNADSKITFPQSFTKLKERKVELIGEAYFEVTKNPTKPFTIQSNEQLVTVTGTHLNVCCYPKSENMQTTLAEGSVVVSLPKTGAHINLSPGKQAIVTSHEILVKQVNPDDIIAWKDGLFVFVQTPLQQVLREISRWYNVEVDYSNMPQISFDGEISRKIPLSEVLRSIEISSNIKLKMEGRRIMIN
ncbi:FecR domain-containing protein [Chitinophaga sp. MM2321]|uniref:FecR family protein n=1 Tax=Chitinophaga sp. MM2321 TaxID=3137178 RepID=UPI0032D5AC64